VTHSSELTHERFCVGHERLVEVPSSGNAQVDGCVPYSVWCVGCMPRLASKQRCLRTAPVCPKAGLSYCILPAMFHVSVTALPFSPPIQCAWPEHNGCGCAASAGAGGAWC
jgi:hypothetical protein